MKKLILICGFLASSLSYGADWIYVTEGGGLSFFIDKSFYKYDSSNKTVDVWTKTTKKKIFDGSYYTSSKTLTKYSCANMESRILANIEYDTDGSVLSSNTKPSSRFELIFPDSVGETIWVSSCLSQGKGFNFPKYEPEFVDLDKLGYKAP
ncbi:surface-adhesin E family protein [Acinetobacter sp. AS167]|uniref:surface-adhesin E family protein n=1 Tax=Acinetobacter sp. AS167 TaxID=3127884 RepID=UPI00301AD53A